MTTNVSTPYDRGKQARAIDEMHLALRPTLLGRGEALWQGLDLPALGYRCVETIVGERATHVVVRRTPE